MWIIFILKGISPGAFPPSQLCANGFDTNSSVCSGDSGGKQYEVALHKNICEPEKVAYIIKLVCQETIKLLNIYFLNRQEFH